MKHMASGGSLPILDSTELDAFFLSIARTPPIKEIMCPTTNIENWTQEEVYRYLDSLCSAYNISNVHVKNFRKISGHQLLKMTLENFKRLDPLNGTFFYNQIRINPDPYDTLNGSGSSFYNLNTPEYSCNNIPSPPMVSEIQHANSGMEYNFQSPQPYLSPPVEYHDVHYQPPVTSPLTPVSSLTPDEGLLSPSLREDARWDNTMPSMPSSPYDYCPPGAYGSPYHEVSSPPLYNAAESPYPDQAFDDSVHGSPSSSMYHSPEGACGVTSHHDQYQLEEFDHLYIEGSPTSNQEIGEGAPQGEIKTSGTPKKPRRERGPKLYEFLWCLLLDPESNPSLIRWESVEERVFRLVNQGELSRRWGERRPNKENRNLPYEHLARAIRYHYQKGAVESVPDKKLVYRFGKETFNDLCQKYGPPQ